MPKGANASFVDRMADTERDGNDQREVLVDKGSFFKSLISDIKLLYTIISHGHSQQKRKSSV